MQAECGRHKLPFAPTMRRGESYYVVRCAHVGPRFVVHIRNWESGFNIVDYVEDLPDGEMIVEAHDGESDDDLAALFDALRARMVADDPPLPGDE